MFGVFGFDVRTLEASALGLAEPRKEAGRDDDNVPVLGGRGVEEPTQSSAVRAKLCVLCGGAETGGGSEVFCSRYEWPDEGGGLISRPDCEVPTIPGRSLLDRFWV